MRLLLLLALLAAPARAWELQLASPPDWALGVPLSAGRLLPNFQLHYRAGALQLRAEGQLQGVGFSSERFSVARLSGHIRLQARQWRNGWQGSLQLTLNGGELVWDALYLNFDQLASQLSGEFTIRPGYYHFRNIQMETPRNSLRAEVLITPKRKRFNIEDIRGDAEALYQNYAKPFLGDSAFNEMSLSGRIGGNGLYDNGLRSFNVVLHHISIRDGQRRFQVDDLDGQLGNDGRPSRLRWAGARWRAIPIGRSEARFTLRGRQLTLGAPLRIPLADGALLIRRLQPQGGGYRVDAELEPLTLAALRSALYDLKFNGQISGKFPQLFISWQKISLGRPVFVDVFGGRLTLSRLALNGLLSSVPELSFDMKIDGIDLQKLTDFLEIGKITGLLDGQARNVRLLGWRLNAFELSLRANRGQRRIDHRAVSYLTRAGGTGALVGQFVRFLNSFPYEQLGFNGVLNNGVLTLQGFENHKSGGFYLLKGSAIPRLDIIAFQRRVDFRELLKRLKSLEQTDSPIIE